MIRLALAVLAVALVAVVAVLVFDNGYGGPSCVAIVFMSREATQSQTRSVLERLRSDGQVARVTVVTREEAFKKMKKQFPQLMQSVPSNPFGTNIRVHLRRHVSPFGFESRYVALHLPQVDSVSLEGPHGPCR